MENFNTEKIYFVPGDIVTIKHNIANKPEMIVKAKETKLIKKDNDNTTFIGIRCFWFKTDGELQEHIFNTKDLVHINK